MDDLRTRLADAEAALRFYAKASTNLNILLSQDAEPCDVPDDDGDTVMIFGKRARAYFAKYVQEANASA